MWSRDWVLSLLLFALLACALCESTCTSTCGTSASASVPLTSQATPDHELGNAGRVWKELYAHTITEPLSPVVLVPGLLGSGLQSKLTKAKLPALCAKNADWDRIWIQPNRVLQVNCFIETMTMSFDPETDTFHNVQGVDIKTVDFGGLDGVSYLAWNDDGPIKSSEYFQPLISNLEAAGYVAGQNLVAAPYDWRQTTNPSGWNDQTKDLIESLYEKNGNLPVYVLCHSMGNMVFSSFLSTVDQEWKDTYIKGFLSVAAPWSGASLALRTLISGIELQFGEFSLPAELVVKLAQTWGSVIWLVPDEILLGSSPLVVVNETTYSYDQIGQLLLDIGATETYEIFQTLEGSLPAFGPPGVPIYCLYGTNRPTELWYEYANGLDKQPTCIHCDSGGDGVVPLQSLTKCLEMNPVDSQSFNLIGHMDLVKDPKFFNYVMDVLSGKI